MVDARRKALLPGTRVYVSGPYSSSGTVAANVACAREAGARLFEVGLNPFVPHLEAHAYDEAGARFSWDRWMAWCEAWLPVCGALLRLPGVSRGADREVALAKRLAIPVFESVEALLAAVRARPVQGGRRPRGVATSPAGASSAPPTPCRRSSR